MSLRPGDRLEVDMDTAFDVEEAIGRGATADVYRVRARRSDDRYALKVLTDASPSLTRRLRQEFALQQGLIHPNIVRTLRLLDLPNGAPAILMELIEGPSLAELIHMRITSIELVDRLANQILAGAKAAHEAGLIHRDLKPGNILLSTSNGGYVAKLADFGLAKAMDPGDEVSSSRHSTRAGTPMGTPSYMAPEQIRNAKGVDERADVFAIGAVMYEMLCGEPPFDGDMLSVLANAEAGVYHRPGSRVPNLPPRMETAIAGALCPKLDERIPNVATLEALWKGLAPPRPYLLPPDALFGSVPDKRTPAPHGLTGPNGIEFVERMSAPPLRRTPSHRTSNPEPDAPSQSTPSSLRPVITLPERHSLRPVEQDLGERAPIGRVSIRPVEETYPPPAPAGVPFGLAIMGMLGALLIGAAIVAAVVLGLGGRNQVASTVQAASNVSLPSPVTTAEAAQTNPTASTPAPEAVVAVTPPSPSVAPAPPRVAPKPRNDAPDAATRPPPKDEVTSLPIVTTTPVTPPLPIVTTSPVNPVSTQTAPVAEVAKTVMLEDLDVAVRGDVVVITGTLSNGNVRPNAFDQQGADPVYPNQYVIQFKGGGSGLGTHKIPVGTALVTDVTISDTGGKLIITVNSRVVGHLPMTFQSSGNRFTLTVAKP